ncbi:MAG: CHASE3 domain-containing protein [Terriglobales bacterium]|jgi:PAS domain S-box-containing protein
MKTYLPIVAVFLAVLLSGVLSFHELTVLQNDGAVVTHSHNIERELVSLLSQVKDAEAGQRGFLYTNNPEYLQPYKDARAALDSTYARLAWLTNQDAHQRAELAEIHLLLDKKLREMDETVSYQHSGDVAKARALVETNAGFQLMEQIRSAVERLNAEQSVALSEQQSKVRRSALWLYAALAFTSLLILLLLGLLSRALTTTTRARNAERLLRGELQRSYESLDRILKSVAAGFIVLDTENRIVYINQAAGTLLRKSHDGLQGTSIWEVLPEIKGERFQLLLRKAIAAAQESVFEEFLPLLGSWLELHTYPSPAGTSIFLIDVSQRKQAEVALRKAEQLAIAGKFAATVAHEINNPLEAVTNLIYLAAHDGTATPSVLKYLNLAEAELQRVAHITKQTLGFYRETTAPSKFSVSELVEELLTLFTDRLRSKELNVDRLYAADLVVTAVRGEIRQIFANLLVNAIDASPHGGMLQIRVTTSANQAVIQFSDAGPGIPEKDLAKIFEPFFTTKKDVGTGLGLWVAKDLAEKNGGAITVRTGGSIKGANFEVKLPAASATQELSVQAAH